LDFGYRIFVASLDSIEANQEAPQQRISNVKVFVQLVVKPYNEIRNRGIVLASLVAMNKTRSRMTAMLSPFNLQRRLKR
jgi:hypothetical protein